MKTLVTSHGDVLAICNILETLVDRLVCDGVVYPFTALGAYSVLDGAPPSAAHTWNGSAWVAPPAPPPIVPDEVPMASARIILLRSGITAAMLIASINADVTTTAAQKAEALIDFEYRTTVRRESPLTLVLGPAMGLTPAQMDAMFIAAGAL
jgi:hypothetical protein